MITKGSEDFAPTFSTWFGKPVVLVVVLRQCHVPMLCSIVSESAVNLRIRIQPGWEMDVRKELVLAVEEDTAATNPTVN